MQYYILFIGFNCGGMGKHDDLKAYYMYTLSTIIG